MSNRRFFTFSKHGQYSLSTTVCGSHSRWCWVYCRDCRLPSRPNAPYLVRVPFQLPFSALELLNYRYMALALIVISPAVAKCTCHRDRYYLLAAAPRAVMLPVRPCYVTTLIKLTTSVIATMNHGVSPPTCNPVTAVALAWLIFCRTVE